MYPYPSGDLHMGHMRNYTIGDVVARYRLMKGYNVLHPMGYDAFGLPAEQAAIERGMHPRIWTEQCIPKMRRQFDMLGISFDWDREIDSSKPEYYRWTQWFFLKFYERDLAYKKKAPVNWCPRCEVVLANEEVVSGRCWRCDSPAVSRELDQWFFRITAYADRLLQDIELLEEWPERVKVMQRNWIGRSEGVQFDMPVAGAVEAPGGADNLRIPVFTTRPDTCYGITYVVLAPEHQLVDSLIADSETAKKVNALKNRAGSLTEMQRAAEGKEGVFTGSYAINPLTGERVAIWVADYVLAEYGTGAIMAVPAHDQRDFEFAREHGLPIRVVIEPPGQHLDPGQMEEAYLEPGVQVNSGPFDGQPNDRAWHAIADYMEQRGIGRRTVNYRLRDWLISRQRYWGAPIPIIYCDSCGTVPVPEEDLPVLLPLNVEFTGKGGNPLEKVPDFVRVACPKCQRPGRRETDTMGTFVDSSWYFLRFASPGEAKAPFDEHAVHMWMPVDQYVGGIEHATLHLIYARFFTKVLFDMGLVKFSEPFARLFTQGMVYKDGAKMSKSRGNVVSPDEMCQKYGADTARLFILFLGPADEDAEWSDRGVEGSFRFLNRFWKLVVGNMELYDPNWQSTLVGQKQPALARQTTGGPGMSPGTTPQALRRKTHETIRKVSGDIERLHLNTAISALMELANQAADFAAQANPQDIEARAVFSEAIEALTLLLCPFSPHICEEVWHRLGRRESACLQAWPKFDAEAAAAEQVTLVVQVNGKVRARLTVDAHMPDDQLQETALASPGVQRHIEGKKLEKVVVVGRAEDRSSRLVNIVARSGPREEGPSGSLFEGLDDARSRW
jgi:leucyl-tRNA synthetase